MKIRREPKDKRRAQVNRSSSGSGLRHPPPISGMVRAFTLIEIMMVVAIMGIVLAMGVPSILRSLQKEGMRKVVSDVDEVCRNARARAIMQGQTTAVVFHPLDRHFEVESGASESGSPSIPGSSGVSAQFPDNVTIEMLDVNLLEYRESEFVRVRFFPDGTSDEMTLILRSSDNEWRALSLEITTGMVGVETDPHKFGR